MIISTKKGTPQVELDRIVDNFEKQGLSVTLIRGTDYNVFGLVGDTTKIAEKDVLANPWVENVTRVSAPYKRANRLFHPEDTVVDVNGVKIGGKSPIAVMAGPCSVEGEAHTIKMAKAVKAGGANFLRGGAYKPRTSPYDFSGLGAEGGSHIMHIPHLIPLVCGQGSNDPISASGHSTIDSKCCGLISGHISVISVEANGTTTA